MSAESTHPVACLEETLARLRQTGASDRAARHIAENEADIVERLRRLVLANVPAFTDSANPQVVPLLTEHLREVVAMLVILVRGDSPVALEFVERYAKTAAEQYFPLEPILHAYRCCMKVLLPDFADALAGNADRERENAVTAAADCLLAYVDALSFIAAEHHVDRSRLLADVASDQRSELLSILLGGYDESDRRVSRVLRDAGYLDRRLAFCVVLAQSIDPSEMQHPARARRLGDHVDRVLAGAPGKRLVDIHRNKVTIVISHVRRLSGWSSPDGSLVEPIAEQLLKVGPAARIGVSNDVLSTSQIPAAYQQASLAFEVSSVGHRVVRFSDIALQQLMLHFAGESFRRVLPAWSQRFFAADDKSRGQLTRTLRVYADQDMNVLKTAKQLKVHPNTLYARFEKIASVTGRDPRRFWSLNELVIVSDCRGN